MGTRVDELGSWQLFTSVDKEGTGEGFAELIAKISSLVSIPVIAHGQGKKAGCC
jgi:imidazole glycerol phosphate synthase subunit HisF